MNPLRLRLRERPQQRIDMTSLTPDKLTGSGVAEIAALRLKLGRHERRVDALFELDGEETSTVILDNASDRLDNIGAHMRQGRLFVHGDAGFYLGRGMRGGEIQVSGSCGAFAGAGMRGGEIHIDGDAGDFLGAPPSGERLGMNGGLILVKGHAGDRVGDRQRRGTILIEGDAGAYCASSMIAGTIAILGQAGANLGMDMRRGTLLLTREPESLPPTFNDNDERELNFLSVLLSSFAHLNSHFARLPRGDYRVHRYLGDRACGGLGEVLVWPAGQRSVS